MLTGAYASFATIVVGWLLLSVAVGQCDAGGAVPAGIRKISPRADDPAEIARCRNDLERLIEDLHRAKVDIEARALRYETDPAAEWRYWSRGYLHRWRALGERCRLSELKGTDVNPIIDKLAAVHEELPALLRAVGASVTGYAENVLGRIRRLRRSLRAIKVPVDHTRTGARPSESAPAGAQRRR